MAQIGDKNMRDRRVTRTKKSIQKAYLDLLQNKGTDKITISDIAREADIDRKTFYLHYNSTEDIIKEYAEEKYSDAEFEELCKQYDHAVPFTKESLLYRQIFEKYYPGQSEMIVDFWMPNKSWEGCNVNDPSARVLSNYGDSGK